MERRFQVFKQSICGNQVRRDHVPNLTLGECRDLRKYPAGVHSDAKGKFTWGYSIMDGKHREPERGSVRAQLAAEFLPDLRRHLRHV